MSLPELPSILAVRDWDSIAERYRVEGTPVILRGMQERVIIAELADGTRLEQLTQDLRAEFDGQCLTAESAHAIGKRIQARYL